MLADEQFTAQNISPLQSPLISAADKFDQLHKEDIASGASYAIETYNRIHGVSILNFAPFTVDSIFPRQFEPTVLLAHRLRELIDLEASVFRLGYKCAAHGNQSYRLVPPNDIFGMAISLGYMKLTWHQYTALSKMDTDATSFNEICAQFLDKFGTEMIRFVTVGGLAPLRIRITEPIGKWLSQNLFLVDTYYREEAIDIAANCYELMTDFQTLTSAHLGVLAHDRRNHKNWPDFSIPCLRDETQH